MFTTTRLHHPGSVDVGPDALSSLVVGDRMSEVLQVRATIVSGSVV